MSTKRRVLLALPLAAAALAWVLWQVPAQSQDGGHHHEGGHEAGEGHEHGEEGAGHSHEAAEAHGGEATMTKEFHFEVAFHSDGVHVHLYDGKQAPISGKGVTGSVDVKFKDAKRALLHAELAWVEDAAAGGYLGARLELTKIDEGDAKATFKLKGLPGKAEKDVEFTQSFKMARSLGWACPTCKATSTKPGDCAKCGKDMVAQKSHYACSMHPEVVSDKEGTCWKCNMKLTRVEDKPEAGGGDGHADHDHGGHEHKH
ncbi:MAG: hypothetical protein HYZ53_19525 [Planctomycetes bacterium]|nr:hypothetical protein [Planctomycetota bacterium]